MNRIMNSDDEHLARIETKKEFSDIRKLANERVWFRGRWRILGKLTLPEMEEALAAIDPLALLASRYGSDVTFGEMAEMMQEPDD